jgi:hypothetical protein
MQLSPKKQAKRLNAVDPAAREALRLMRWRYALACPSKYPVLLVKRLTKLLDGAASCEAFLA